MPISEKDAKLLWGMAGGHCSNPGCRKRVAERGEKGRSFLTGEMAHIIARQADGPRGDGVGGDNTYDNLVLLCPNCHTAIDKCPDNHPPELLHSWKKQHEDWVDSWSDCKKMDSTVALMSFVKDLLSENHHYFVSYGPKSAEAQQNPASSAHVVWTARRLDTILPNNRKILKALEVNSDVIPGEMKLDVIKFKDHALGYEQQTYERIDHYPLFPQSFSDNVNKWSAQ